MASIFSWLRRVWSGSRNEPYREYPVAYASSHPPSNVAQTSYAKGPTATTSELPVTGVSYPDLSGFPLQGIFNLHLNTTNNTFTSYPHIRLDPAPGSNPGRGDIISIRLNTADNTWTSDRPIYRDATNEGTPELGTSPTRTSSVAATSSPSTVQGYDHASLRGSARGSTTSVIIGSEVGQFTRYRGQRSASAVSRTERGDSTHPAHDRSTSSPQTLSPALSNAVSMPSLSEMEPFTPGRNERSASTMSRTERGDSRRTHGCSPSSADPLLPAAELESTQRVNRDQSRRFNPIFSPPTPPESSAVLYDGPSIKREQSLSMSTSGSPRQANSQPEMEQITHTRAQPAAVKKPFQTPSKPTRHSTIDSQPSMAGGAALSTPPPTDSARRHPPFIFHGVQVGEGSQTTFPPSPTSPTPINRTINSPLTFAPPLFPTNPNPTVPQPTITPIPPQAPLFPPNPSPTVTQPTPSTAPQFPANPPVVDPTARHPIRRSDTMEFTSLKDTYAQPLVNGYRILPTRGPECLSCHQRMTLQGPTRGGPNEGRRYYTCVAGGHGWNFGTFADLEGRDDSRTCDCGEASRRTETQRGDHFWKCMEMRCAWKRFS